MQTLKFAKVRGKSDPDFPDNRYGIYYGNNVPGMYSGRAIMAHRTTRGAFVR